METLQTPAPAAVEAAADAIIDAFAATDGERYFAGFASDASFVFHTEPARLDDRAAYERLWAGWVDSGWRVASCASSERLVQVYPGGAVFTHSVDTSVTSPDGPSSYRERESIVFVQRGDRLVAVHEHLSPMP